MSVAHAMPRRPSHICRVQAERDRVGGAGEGWAVAGRDGPWRGRLGRGGEGWAVAGGARTVLESQFMTLRSAAVPP